MTNNKSVLGFVLIAFTAITVCTTLWLQASIAQEHSYHKFAGDVVILGIPNFWNVVSNFAFIIIGCIGLYKLHISQSLTVLNGNRGTYSLLFFGVALVGLGSGYYHWSPNNGTLVWDRLPMTIAFMALFSIIISEYISKVWGRWLLLPFLLIGIISVAYWHYTELQGQGDLRLYALVQFLPMLLIPIILLCFQPIYNKVSGYWLLLIAYMLSKTLEHFDRHFFEMFGFISGHPLKHLFAALGIYFLILAYQQRKKLPPHAHLK